jgi:hypothetical protein
MIDLIKEDEGIIYALGFIVLGWWLCVLFFDLYYLKELL